VSRKTNSAYADCQSMKLESRCSPELRRNRSPSGRSGSSRYFWMVFSVMAPGLSLPSATSRAMADTASAISARPP
jgi:hypothetical protein